MIQVAQLSQRPCCRVGLRVDLALLALPHPSKKNSSNLDAIHKWPWSGLGGEGVRTSGPPAQRRPCSRSTFSKSVVVSASPLQSTPLIFIEPRLFDLLCVTLKSNNSDEDEKWSLIRQAYRWSADVAVYSLQDVRGVNGSVVRVGTVIRWLYRTCISHPIQVQAKLPNPTTFTHHSSERCDLLDAIFQHFPYYFH